MIRYWVVTDKFLVMGGDISQTIEHKFETREKAEAWKKEKEKENAKKRCKMDRHEYRLEERKIKFTGEEEPLHDWGSGYHTEW